jgi:AcrR family transcriptional regulator
MARAAKTAEARWTGAVQSREEQFELKRRAVILAAGRAMAQRGFASTSLDDVAKTLNVTKPALYYYVRSKHEILFEYHKLAFELGARCRAEALAKGRTGLDKLLIYLRAYVTGLIEELGGGSAMTEYHHLTPEAQRELQPLRDEYDRFYRGLIAEGVRDGSIRAVDPKMTIFFVVGAVRGIHRWYDPAGPLRAAEIAEAFVDLVRAALEARG